MRQLPFTFSKAKIVFIWSSRFHANSRTLSNFTFVHRNGEYLKSWDQHVYVMTGKGIDLNYRGSYFEMMSTTGF